jgi:hypothetical protein
MTNQRVSNRRTLWLTICLLLGVALLLTACDTPESAASCPEVELVECPEVACLQPVSYDDLWASSGHADAKSEAFTHWDEEDPQEIPTDCAKCHSRPGYTDFLGVDGTEAGQVDNAAKIGTTVTCFVCHNEATGDMDRVIFPSGAKVTGLGAEASCIQCHQGRASTAMVDDAIAEAGLIDGDTTSEELGFMYGHYPSGAIPFGTEAGIAYEYEGKTYSGRFTRGEDFFSCLQCHDKHTLEIEIETCRECHTSARQEAIEIRVDTTDFDGDGDIEEGIVGEIETIHNALYTAIQGYAKDVAGTPIAYDPIAYPFFFIDTDADGEIDPEEAIYPNSYNAWTPRLLRAVYNYLLAAKDPGAFAHNADYMIQVLYDSLADIGGSTAGLSRPEVQASREP